MNESRVVYITGGAQGIGKGIAVGLLHRGYRVVITDIDEEAGRECAAELSSMGTLLFISADVRDEGAVAASIGEAVARFGRLDGLVNNAALADPVRGPVENLNLEAWRQVIDTNLTGAFLTVKHAVPHLRRVRGGIVNIASTRALQSEPDTEAYAASKGGLVALTHALAVSLGPEIRVNAISPGWIDVSRWQKRAERRPAELRGIDHRQHPAGRVGTPEDVTGLAAFLLSEAAGFITGQNFVVDGGMTRRMIYEE
ncbi:MAG: SDR family oxidoreductase [Desulfuromonadaceae bacterium]|nr:SDR family oxidoreductase [Desulfuromonadaceae bacterium]